MQIIPLLKLTEFAKQNASTKGPLAVWKETVENAIWKKSTDVLLTYPKAKILKNNRARFEIMGNSFRIVVEIDYEDEIVNIIFIGSHAEYDKINATTHRG